MISALSWIPKGAANLATPAQPDPASDSDVNEGDSDNAEIEQAQRVAAALRATGAGPSDREPGAEDEAMAELNLEDYDESDEDESGRRIFGSSNPGMAFYKDNKQDPYMAQIADDEDSDAGLDEVQPDDHLIVTSRSEDDVSYLEVWVYQEAESTGDVPNIYVHHDLLLPAFPLSLAWVGCERLGGAPGRNFAAVGTSDPGIEIWDLDASDAVEPVVTLGGVPREAVLASETVDEDDMAPAEGKMNKKKKRRQQAEAALAGTSAGVNQALRPGSHTDAVLGLAWNPASPNVLASASADASAKIWDLNTAQCQATLTHHSDKVQALAWNPAEAAVLLTAAFDRSAALADVRLPTAATPKWELSADAECAAWSIAQPTQFLVASEDGVVACFDGRAGAGSAPIFRLAAHDKPTCAISFCAAAPNLLATASADKLVKLWNVSGNQPSMVASQNLKAGSVFAGGFSANAPHLFAVGGAKGSVAVWDVLSSAAVTSSFGRAISRAPG
ncbi:hypothetical protein WJX74_002048 [Apatococcus lobatus]|uniref:Uncharacterized protein n=2 Tax=Apatococcus TaxID=904362 RepID=A0AAW1T030_9CHLO